MQPNSELYRASARPFEAILASDCPKSLMEAGLHRAAALTGANESYWWSELDDRPVQVTRLRILDGEAVLDTLVDGAELLCVENVVRKNPNALYWKHPHQGLHWHRVSAKNSPSHLVVLSDKPSLAESVQEQLQELLALIHLKESNLQSLENAEDQQRQFNRWFETMDSQIRVLERERQKLAGLVHKSDGGAAVLGSDLRFRWVNPVISENFGAKGNPASMIGSHCNAICESEDGPCERCPVKQVVETGKVVHQERTRQLAGEKRYFYVSAFPIRSPEGNVDEILTTVQDLTDLETLRKSEARYQTLFERSTDAILIADTQSLQILMANPQAQALMNLSESSLVETSLLDIHPEDARESMAGHYRNLAYGGKLNDLEMEVLGSDGTQLTCNASGTLFDLDEKRVIFVEYRDVTQIRKLQGELARADHLITLGTMNAGIAHEFKNRLAPLRAFAQLVTQDSTTLKRVQKFGPMIIREVDRLGALVRDVLDYARPQSPDPGLVAVNPLLAGLVEELGEEFLTTSGNSDVQIKTQFDIPDDLCVFLDAEQIRRAFINIFKNSFEALEKSEGSDPELLISCSEQNEQLVIAFHDNGTGIKDTDQSRVFDPFFTTKGTKGTGLGMCIVKSLVETNDGQIQIDSEWGKGTEVEMQFPICRHSARTAA
ncbi:MAG: PAS domain-containing protein [Candidatus Eisenbacteria bacterium]|uniref:histidine kinase n=1 Tax=Eiseniibacteriota bacterium TaxID=2212470 RepID=A0A7Y2EBU4_UNCEI|nr:PAS domain-containing protein [Candidatus Eisenbacteria bacterium]